MTSFRLEVSGTRAWSDEGPVPAGLPAPASTFDNTVTFQLDPFRLTVDVTRTVIFDGVSVPQSFREIAQGQLAHVDGVESLFGAPTGDLPSDRAAALIKEQRLLNPHLILADMLNTPSLGVETETQSYNGRPHVLFEVSDPVAPIIFWIDAETHLISRLTTIENHPLRRDVAIQAIYTDWNEGTNVRFPAKVEFRMDDDVIHTEARSLNLA